MNGSRPYHTRSASSHLRRLVESFPVVVVTGARQVGKSTLIDHLFGADAEKVVFDPLIDVESARADPDLFLDAHRTPLILDEIQYAPEVLPALKRRVDKKRQPGQYVVSGSQQWQVMKFLAESMAGRAVFCDLDHFSLLEVANYVSRSRRSWIVDVLTRPQSRLPLIERLPLGRSPADQIWRGSLPEAQFLDRDVLPAFHEGYIRTYIERDVRLLENIGDLRQFRRFYRLVSALTAQELNYNHFGRDIGISPHTAKRWLSVLSSTFQVEEIPPFSRNTVKRISKKPKVHATDTGIVCHNLTIATPAGMLGHPSWGALFETACVMEIARQCRLLSPRPVLYHWKTHSGAEVDLVIEYNGRYTLIEVKAGTHPTKGDTRGLRAFRETYGDLASAPGYIVAPTEGTWQIGENDFVVPWDGYVDREDG